MFVLELAVDMCVFIVNGLMFFTKSHQINIIFPFSDGPIFIICVCVILFWIGVASMVFSGGF